MWNQYVAFSGPSTGPIKLFFIFLFISNLRKVCFMMIACLLRGNFSILWEKTLMADISSNYSVIECWFFIFFFFFLLFALPFLCPFTFTSFPFNPFKNIYNRPILLKDRCYRYYNFYYKFITYCNGLDGVLLWVPLITIFSYSTLVPLFLTHFTLLGISLKKKKKSLTRDYSFGQNFHLNKLKFF